MFRIAVNNEIDLDAEVPAVHMMKLNPGANVRVSRDSGQDVVGRVRLVSPQIDRNTQLGHVRITLTSNPSLKIGMFAQASIDAKRSCGVAIPRTAIDHLTVQVVKGNTVETRRVQVGLVSDKMTEILEGLDVDETVVADAGSSLHDGDQIKTKFRRGLSIERRCADGAEYLGMVDPQSASIRRIFDHPFGARLGQLYQARGDAAAERRYPRDLGCGLAIRRGAGRT